MYRATLVYGEEDIKVLLPDTPGQIHIIPDTIQNRLFVSGLIVGKVDEYGHPMEFPNYISPLGFEAAARGHIAKSNAPLSVPRPLDEL